MHRYNKHDHLEAQIKQKCIQTCAKIVYMDIWNSMCLIQYYMNEVELFVYE